MLTNLKNILKIAEAKKCAVGSFNTPNFESLRAVIGAAEDLNQPVIIMHAEIHEEMGLCKMEEIAPLMLFMAERAAVPVCVHLDHGTDLDYVKRGIDLGFTSVMYDGSEEEYRRKPCKHLHRKRACGQKRKRCVGRSRGRKHGFERVRRR